MQFAHHDGGGVAGGAWRDDDVGASVSQHSKASQAGESGELVENHGEESVGVGQRDQ